jgi:aspartate/methionine/tyrosine aminotransferase
MNDRPSVWLEFSPLAKATNSINLGQGFPNWAPPNFVQQFATKSVSGGEYSTYARSAGQHELVQVITDQYRPQLNRDLNPLKNIVVTNGASQGLYLAMASFLRAGDEVLIIEPAFDIYEGILNWVGANIKTTQLLIDEEDDRKFIFDWKDLAYKLSEKTKMIVLNTPHNPTGKIMTMEEIDKLEGLLAPYPDCIVISDEVYEHLTFEQTHIPLASRGNLFDRTLSIYSAGKTFSVTGWKIGWCIGPEHLVHRMQMNQQWMVFSVATPLQVAVANSLVEAKNEYLGESNYFQWVNQDYQEKRDLLFLGLKQLGLRPVKPEGTFFIMCEIDHLKIEWEHFSKQFESIIKQNHIIIDSECFSHRDYQLARVLAIEYQVVSIPMSCFYIDKKHSSNQRWLRFAFCKQNQILEQGLENLSIYRLK